MPPGAPIKPTIVPFPAANQIAQRVTPVREGATQIFGDPTQPNLKSLKDYATLFDSPASRERIGSYLRLALDGLNDETTKHGGLLTLLSFYGGVPQALAAAKADAQAQSKAKLTPDEQEAANSLMSAYGAIIGLRSLTKASAAQFSVKRLEAELPLPGVNSVSSADYQLQRLAEQVYNGTRMLPLPQNEKDFMKQQVTDLAGKRDAARKPKRLTAPPGSTAEDLERKLGIPVR
jgi:hypothetical protein